MAQRTGEPRFRWGRERRPARAWADLSLRTKLLLFALGLVTVPGVVFALFAFAGVRTALQREVGIQLQQTAERGAEALAAAVERALSDARSWARQDVMRDLVIADLDKRVSRFLRTVRDNNKYLEILTVDRHGGVIAASGGERIGQPLPSWAAAALAHPDVLVGPLSAPELGREVVAIGVSIDDPDAPHARLATLVLACDWAAMLRPLEAIRVKLASLGKPVAALVLGPDGRTIGGVGFDGGRPPELALAAAPRAAAATTGHEMHPDAGRNAAAPELLVGTAPVSAPAPGWSVLFAERAEAALAPVRHLRRRWAAAIAGLLLLGLAAAALLARQILRPLRDVTDATSEIAAHPDLERPLLPVRSRNEVGQLTESFNAMTIELKRSQDEALSAAKFAFAGELAAMVAHEVRTPLSVMRSSAQMLASPSAADRAHTAELADTIVAEVDRVDRVVTGLIQLARPIEQRIDPTPLAELLTRAADLVAAQARRQAVSLTCDVTTPQPPARCDPEQMYQVILNLVVNALQVVPAACTIALRTVPAERGSVGFEIADDGPGLPAALRDRIFRPFVTGREHGTGLGLAFVDRIVKAHGGTVAVRSEPGHGTVFTVRVPAATEVG